MNKMCIRTLAIIALAASSVFADDAFGQVARSAQQTKNAQQDVTVGAEEKDYVFLFGNVHRDTAVLRVLIQNAPDYFNAPDMPRFAIIGKERKFYLGIGGYAKASISYDFANPITNPLCFVTSSIPMENMPGNGALVQMNAGASNLFFNFIALPHTKNQIGAYINFDFSGNNADYGFSLKSAYLTYKGFTLGFKPSLFTDGAACAPTVDQQGPNAMTFVFNTVLNYQYAFNSHWKVGAGLEMPVVNATYNEYSYQVNQRIPDIPFYGQFSYKDGTAWIRLSGLIRNMYYRDDIDGSTEDVLGYGVKLSGTTPIGRQLKLFYQTVYGKGLGSYIQDLQGLGLDMAPKDTVQSGSLESVEALGSYTGLMWQISPKFCTSATFSEVECFLPNSVVSSTYKRGIYVVANVFYNITPSVQAGMEYLWGSRENVNGETHHNTRLQTAVRVNF